MLHDLNAVLNRSAGTLLEDTVGVALLFSLLFAALYLPGLV